MKTLDCSVLGELLSLLLTVILALLLAGSTCSLAYAKDGYQVSYEGSAKGLVSPDQDFFAHFDVLMPGDTATGSVQVRNNGQTAQSLGFRADPEGSSPTEPADLLQKLQLTVTSGKACLYKGSLAADELGSTVELGSFEPQEEADLDFAVSCPADLGNSYALSSADVRWVFTAIDADGSSGAGPSGSDGSDGLGKAASGPANGSPAGSDGVALAKTGASTTLLAAAACLLALAGALSLSRVGRNSTCARTSRTKSLAWDGRAAAASTLPLRKAAPKALKNIRGFALPTLLITTLAIGITSLALLCTGGTALAHFVDCTDSTENPLSIGENTIQIEEEFPAAPDLKPGSTLTKKVQIKNTGNTACYVRVLVSFSTKQAHSNCTLDFDRTAWARGKDGYDYYQLELEPGRETKPLFTTVKIAANAPTAGSGSIAPFDLDVKAESVVANPDLSPEEAFASK